MRSLLFVCQGGLQTCTSAVNLDDRLNIYSLLRLLKPFLCACAVEAVCV